MLSTSGEAAAALPPLPPLRRRMRARLGLLMAVLVMLWALVWARSPVPASQSDDGRAALATQLARQGLTVDQDSVLWLEEPKGALGLRPVLLRAHRKGELHDLYYADVRASEAGAVLDVWSLTNITRTSSAQESAPVRVAGKVVYAAQVGELFNAVVLLDPHGEPAGLTRGWPNAKRLQNRVSNLQETGRAAGFGRTRYQFVPAAETLAIGEQQGQVRLLADAEVVLIDADSGEPGEGAYRLRVQRQVKGRPGNLTWLVDTVRNVSWIGPEPIEWLEHTVFGVTDRANRAYHDVVGTDTEAEVAEALGVTHLSEERRALLTATDPELGWPPAPVQPPLDRSVRGEGQWLPVVDDAFVNDYENAPPAFYQTFVRVDPERGFARVYITLWDPRQVQLHIAMGTREPESATGETGSGRIPRDPALLKRLVGGFNGGFQALHGEFGMMSEDRVYLPPKPFAATVAVYDDGRVGMGSWPGPKRSRWDEETANRQIPSDMIAMRQNLTSVVEDGRYNPWKRWWWGAAPEWVEEQTYIHRSGLCLTQDGFMAYLWGESMGPEELGKAMQALRCARGMHLDMNSKHTGLEFYRPFAPGEALPPLNRALKEAEHESASPEPDGYRFRARKAVTTMAPLRFPRYLGRDPRDFFFLSLKPVLPGPDLQVGTQRIGFSTQGLPNAGWPHAMARARLAAGDGRGTWLVRIDPTRALPRTASEVGPGRVLARLGPAAGVQAVADAVPSAGPALFVERVRGRLRHRVGQPPPGAHVILAGSRLQQGEAAAAAIGVDGDGFLVYGEAQAEDRPHLWTRMRRAGVEQSLRLPSGSRLSFVMPGRQVAVDGQQEIELDVGQGLAFVAETRAAASVMFPDTKPRPYRRWGWLQGKRVRYFPEGEARFKAPEEVK